MLATWFLLSPWLTVVFIAFFAWLPPIFYALSSTSWSAVPLTRAVAQVQRVLAQRERDESQLRAQKWKKTRDGAKCLC